MLFWGQHGVTRDLPLAIEYFNEYLANNPADPLANYDMAVILLRVSIDIAVILPRVSVGKVGFVINKSAAYGCKHFQQVDLLCIFHFFIFLDY